MTAVLPSVLRDVRPHLWHRLLLLACVLAVPASHAAAQSERPTAQRVRAGQVVRIRLAEGAPIEGRFAGLDTARGAFQLDGPSRTIPIAGIDALWLRRPATGRGALVGGIAVGGAMLATTVFVCRILGEGECRQWDGVALYTVAGVAGGALVGAGIGTLFTRWKRIDPRGVTLSLGATDRRLVMAARIGF